MGQRLSSSASSLWTYCDNYYDLNGTNKSRLLATSTVPVEDLTEKECIRMYVQQLKKFKIASSLQSLVLVPLTSWSKKDYDKLMLYYDALTLEEQQRLNEEYGDPPDYYYVPVSIVNKK